MSVVQQTMNDINCTICLEKIVPEDQAPREEEKPRILVDCSHIFHRECIGLWLAQRHNCPTCRHPVLVDTPEAPSPEMSIEEILAVPDHEDDIDVLSTVRENILAARQMRTMNLNENSVAAGTARKINAFALQFFR